MRSDIKSFEFTPEPTSGEALNLRRRAPRRGPNMATRRGIFFALVAITMLALVAGLAVVFMQGGFTVLELLMLVLFAVNLPWLTIGFWNAAIGFGLLRLFRDPLAKVFPLTVARIGIPGPLSRNAIVVPVHEENPEDVFRALRATIASLDATGRGLLFDIFILSDTRTESTARREVELFREWQATDSEPARLFYRRRSVSTGFKAGNIQDFCRRWGSNYDHMIVLDADSVMSGPAILRLVGLMEANPRLGIVQTLITGLPSSSPFARIFQFGMRHGMRAYAMGSAWWQGEAGSYWGHNAIIRLRPFLGQCRLPRVPGRPPLGGDVLSHDQLEAVLMRRAGYDVRVLPIEDGSFEANPPTLLEYIRRDLRWCFGNMQYVRLLHLAGGNRLAWLQLVLAILMYTVSPGWVGFFLLGLAQVVADRFGLPTLMLFPEPAVLANSVATPPLALGLLLAVIGMASAPKLFGWLQVLTSRRERRRYGGGSRVLAGAAIELAFSTLLAPITSTAHSIFIAGLSCGRRLGWASQVRSHYEVRMSEAVRALWPQTLLGAVILVTFGLATPTALLWGAPVAAGLLLAIPFAVATSSRRAGEWLAVRQLCATPEEVNPQPEVVAVVAGMASRWGEGILPPTGATLLSPLPAREKAVKHKVEEPVDPA